MRIRSWVFACIGITACSTEHAVELSNTAGGTTVSWDEFRAAPPMKWEDFRASVAREPVAPYRFVVDGDILLDDEAALRDHYQSWLAQEYAALTQGGEALTVAQSLGVDVTWPRAQRRGLSYCISDSFGARKSEVVAAMDRATRSWSDQVAVQFAYVPAQDAACTNQNANVVFNVIPVSTTAFFASSFFPDSARADRQLEIADEAFTTTEGGRDFEGILRHETGHVLGFRHEHIHIVCTGESAADSRLITSYDVNSVMHYPQCRPSGTGGYRQTSRDFAGAISLYGATLNAGRRSAAKCGVQGCATLWQNDDGWVELWQMNGATITGEPLVSEASADWVIQGTGDFNHDGTSDILWRNTDGRVELWLMNGGTAVATPYVGSASAEWTIQGIGDFNHDGNSDILWRNVDGTVELWLMNGATILAQPIVGSATADWTIQGVGDFNHDGNDDILWRNLDGRVELWLMNGGVTLAQPVVGSAGNDWTIQGAGDFDHDGNSDILWRNTSGAVELWLMNGGLIVSQPGVASAPSDWTIYGVGNL